MTRLHSKVEIFEITAADFKLFWPVFKTVVEAQETYAYDANISYERAYDLWCIEPRVSFVAKENEHVLGSYFLKSNAAGPGSHVCNCGYIVSPDARGKGVARRLCEHSQEAALELGYLAMQFNAVVSSNTVAVKLWQSLGFDIIGTVPNAYNHRKLGLVDSYIMYKQLA